MADPLKVKCGMNGDGGAEIGSYHDNGDIEGEKRDGETKVVLLLDIGVCGE